MARPMEENEIHDEASVVVVNTKAFAALAELTSAVPAFLISSLFRLARHKMSA